MSVFVELTTDAFQSTFANQKTRTERSRRAGAASVRRPLRGLEVKDDTYAIIRVITSTGSEIPLINSGSPTGRSTDYTNFIIQSVQEARMEKHQIVETFGESYIFFFGEAPRFLDVTAILVDSNDFNWYAEFWENYNQYLRGTKSVEYGARTYLLYEDNIVEGYMLNATVAKMSEAPLAAQLSFRLYLTNYMNVSFVEDPNFPVRGSIALPDWAGDVNQITQDAVALQAVLGANLQNIGFGGGESLLNALRQGATPDSVPVGLQGILQNAAEAFNGTMDVPDNLRRKAPVRSLIADNADEFTGAPPLDMPLESGGDEELQQDLDEAVDLSKQALQALTALGADANNPTAARSMGLGPNFYPMGAPIGYGSRPTASASFSASYGAYAGTSFRGVTSGAQSRYSARASASVSFRASLGFRAGARISAGSYYGMSPMAYNSLAYGGLQGSRTGGVINQLNASSFKDLIDLQYTESFGGGTLLQAGVRVSSGVSMGSGIGGGIAGGNTVIPGTFRAQPSPMQAAASYAGTGNGANVTVGGAPSAFAIVAVGGTLTPSGLSTYASSFSNF